MGDCWVIKSWKNQENPFGQPEPKAENKKSVRRRA